MLAPYATDAGGYAALFPPVDLGYSLPVALHAAGVRAGAVAKALPEYAVRPPAGIPVRIPGRTIEEARLVAVRAAADGPVDLYRAVARGRVTLYERLERIAVLPVAEAAGSDVAMLVSPTGALVEKALNLRLPVDLRVFIKRMAGQLKEIDRATALPEVRKAIEALDFNWASMSVGEVERAFTTARAAMRGISTGPLLPAWGEKITVGLKTVIGGVKKYMKETFTPRLALGFNQEDQRAVDQIDEQQGWFLRDEFGRRSDALTAAGRKIVADGLKNGLGRNAIGERLRAQLSGLWNRYGAGYANVVAANAVSRARSYSELASYTETGIEYLEVLAMLDERTTEMCRYMDGQIISVRQCAALNQAAAEDIYKVTPFLEVRRDDDGERFLQTRTGTRVADVLRSGTGNVDDRGQHKALIGGDKLPAKGVGAPPYHHNCRSLTVPRIEMVQVPADRFGRAPLTPAPALACGFAATKWSKKDVCSYNKGAQQVASGPLDEVKPGGVTGTAPKKGKEKLFKPPERTITQPEGAGATLAEHQQAINAFRGKKGAALEFKDPELLASIKGPVLKQIAITKKTPAGVKYYTYVDPTHAKAIEAEIAAKGGKPMASPPAAPPPPRKPKKPPREPTQAPTGAPAAITPRGMKLSHLKKSSALYKRWSESYERTSEASKRIAAEVAETITPEELKGVYSFMRQSNLLMGMDYKVQGFKGVVDALPDISPATEAHGIIKSKAAADMHDLLVDGWNWGYVRTHQIVTGIHSAAKAEFGVASARTPALRDAADQRRFEKSWTKEAEQGVRKWVRAVYNETQRMLKSKGITKLTAKLGIAYSEETEVPGVNFVKGQENARAQIEKVQGYPLTAFAADTREAVKFLSSESKGTNIRRQFLVTQVPASRVWSVPNNGPSVLRETEFIAIGGEIESRSLAWRGTGPFFKSTAQIKALEKQIMAD